jgi:hypothetical protein
MAPRNKAVAVQQVSAVRSRASGRLAPLVFSQASLSAAKWLALVLMFVDHSNKYLFDGSVAWMYALGRISMPLFAFVLGYNLARPGMLASGGYRRLATRLVLFGLLATAPFIALNKLPSGWPLNMMFTLLVAVLAAWLFDKGGSRATIVGCLVLIWGGALGEYWWPAVGLCLCVWAYQRQPSRGLVFGFLACLVLLWFVNGNLWALAALPVLAALQRWWTVKLPRAQWVFYGLYPLHLWLFWWYTSTGSTDAISAAAR